MTYYLAKKPCISSLLRQSLCLLIILGVASYPFHESGGVAGDLSNQFNVCLEATHSNYLNAVQMLLENESEARTYLRSVQHNQFWQTTLLANILMARLDRPDVFRDFQKYLQRLNVQDFPLTERDGELSGPLYFWAIRGVETNVTYRYPSRNMGEKRERVAVSHTDVEVREGKSLNAAAQLAIAEYLWKFPRGTAYEARDRANYLCRIREKAAEYADPWLLSVIDDRQRPPEVRLAAAECLGQKYPAEVCAFLLALISNEHTPTELAGQAINILPLNEGDTCLAAAKRITLADPELRSRLDETIRAAERQGKKLP